MSDVERRAVLEEAKRWLGTPYHHQGRVRGAGVDCAMFPYEVYRAALPHKVYEVPVPNYPPDWHMHRDEELYEEFVQKFATRLTEGATPKPGDFVLYRWGRCYAHGAIVVDWPETVVHVLKNERVRYVEHNRGILQGRPTHLFTLWPEA